LLGGDSAGGNLAAQLLCQIARPNPLLPPIQISRPLQAAFLVSPWLSRHIDDYSYQSNEHIDMLSSHTVKKSVAYFMGDDRNSCSICDLGKLAFPLDSGRDCFQGLDTAARHLYITAGEQEVMKDQITAFAKGVIKFNPKINVEFMLQKEQAHDFILIEGQRGVSGICMESMKTWVKSVLTS
jgi:acetyl esterase/lipase